MRWDCVTDGILLQIYICIYIYTLYFLSVNSIHVHFLVQEGLRILYAHTSRVPQMQAVIALVLLFRLHTPQLWKLLSLSMQCLAAAIFSSSYYLALHLTTIHVCYCLLASHHQRHQQQKQYCGPIARSMRIAGDGVEKPLPTVSTKSVNAFLPGSLLQLT